MGAVEAEYEELYRKVNKVVEHAIKLENNLFAGLPHGTGKIILLKSLELLVENDYKKQELVDTFLQYQSAFNQMLTEHHKKFDIQKLKAVVDLIYQTADLVDQSTVDDSDPGQTASCNDSDWRKEAWIHQEVKQL